MKGAATSECVAITEASHYRLGIILHYYVYAQSHTGNLVTVTYLFYSYYFFSVIGRGHSGKVSKKLFDYVNLFLGNHLI